MALTEEGFLDLIDTEVVRYREKLFEAIDDKRKQFKPSEVEQFLRLWHGYSLAAEWRTWWQESGEEYE